MSDKLSSEGCFCLFSCDYGKCSDQLLMTTKMKQNYYIYTHQLYNLPGGYITAL